MNVIVKGKLVSASSTGVVMLWNPASGTTGIQLAASNWVKLELELEEHHRPINRIDISKSDSSIVATASSDGSIKIIVSFNYN